ncbi:MAG: peptidase S16 [Rhodospirillaceae bacterium]|nr:peptidase S16 [Rhodospirillaceae bacterium]
MAFHSIRDLPDVIPIFPLTGVLLLPRGRLPLNIFEPRYLAMTSDALGSHRFIGMVQPSGEKQAGDRQIPVYGIGCAGRITTFSETEDGRFLITLTGVCRFEIVEELALQKGYRRVRASYDRFADDLKEDDAGVVDRERLLPVLHDYFEANGISADWNAVQEAPCDQLVTSLAMICPFEPREKQALLESPDLRSRADLMISLLEMAIIGGSGGQDSPVN